MIKYKFLTYILIVVFFLFISTNVYPYSGINHGGFTKKTEDSSHILQNYLLLLGFTDFSKTSFTLIFNDGKLKVPPKAEFEDYFANGKKSIHEYKKDQAFNYDSGKHTSTQTAIDWLLFGSILEDNPMIRAAHHFHDPTTGQGLDEACSEIIELLSYLFPWKTGGEFSCKGDSARHRAFNFTTDAAHLNDSGQFAHMYFNWSDDQNSNQYNIRNYLYLALTSPTEKERSHYWAMTLYGLGSELHLLEDMGVPEHVRNDFMEGHAKAKAFLTRSLL